MRVDWQMMTVMTEAFLRPVTLTVATLAPIAALLILADPEHRTFPLTALAEGASAIGMVVLVLSVAGVLVFSRASSRSAGQLVSGQPPVDRPPTSIHAPAARFQPPLKRRS